ncbi:hypothetical protein ABZ894_33690, partial [Nocardia beijingensis]|uniref:hypothetical protein n=1 Tax=Nocardia beijingensis TaxID=95162 RepID=UPI0033DB2188
SDRRWRLRRGRGGHSDASRAANGGCSVSLRSEPGVVVGRGAYAVELQTKRTPVRRLLGAPFEGMVEGGPGA